MCHSPRRSRAISARRHSFVSRSRLTPARLAGALAAPLRRRARFVALDLGLTVLAGVFFDALAEHEVVAQALLLASWLLLVVSLTWLLLRRDERYFRGIAHYSQRLPGFGALYVAAGLFASGLGVLGLGALRGLLGVEALGDGTSQLVNLVLTALGLLALPVAQLALFRRSTAPERGQATGADRRPWSLDLIFGVALLGMSVVSESMIYDVFAHRPGPWYLKPIWLLPAFGLLMLLYLPIRLHCFVDAPRERGNLAWCVVTVTCLSLYVVSGYSLL